jgi:hypothetical protein
LSQLKEHWVTIAGWAKFNPRKDVANPSWFRLEHKLLDDPRFEHFTCAELFTLVALIATASMGNGASFRFNVRRIMVRARAEEAEVRSAMAKLVALGTIFESSSEAEVKEVEARLEAEAKARDAGVTAPSRETVRERASTKRNETEREEEKKDMGAGVAAPSVSQGDVPPNPPSKAPPEPAIARDQAFETCWETYCKKAGGREGSRGEAEESFARLIRTQEDVAAVIRAIGNYLADCEALERYAKQFSRFLGTKKKQPWREWVDKTPARPAAGTGNVVQLKACAACASSSQDPGWIVAWRRDADGRAMVDGKTFFRCLCPKGQSLPAKFPSWEPNSDLRRYYARPDLPDEDQFMASLTSVLTREAEADAAARVRSLAMGSVRSLAHA